jgi:DHA1 family bicyclomycin/chloramphenicol resistance-like MFS transporter
VTGYLGGTLLARRLLPHRGLAATMSIGAWLSLAGGALLTVVALADLRHWVAFIAVQFVYFTAHGILFPGAMAGVVDPFPRQAGAAAGMFGLLTMIVAAAVGSWIGASHDGTLRPLAFTVAGAALAVFAAVRLGVRGVDATGRKHR